MRGTPTDAPTWRRVRGIIPAYAGNTFGPCRRTLLCRDHPRVCGEHFADGTRAEPFQGSSPRMRGTLQPQLLVRPRPGIIPAYAGNTIAVMFSRIDVRDHPRVCGEHFRRVSVASTLQGSSPRMRGTLTIELVDGKAGGIIPAYAGNTLSLISPRPCCRDHPRVCGEHSSHSSFVQTR